MRELQLFPGDASFEPATLEVIGTAFERAWAEIEPHFAGPDAGTARTRLAGAVLVAANRDSKDAGALKDEALQIFAMTYRNRWPIDWRGSMQ